MLVWPPYVAPTERETDDEGFDFVDRQCVLVRHRFFPRCCRSSRETWDETTKTNAFRLAYGLGAISNPEWVAGSFN
jgi:hypothetical protein